uniref:Uncharacterized protein n=1 Tax=Arundo donax TaxID=35708 RepID=A0A0A9AXW6_ARUDO
MYRTPENPAVLNKGNAYGNRYPYIIYILFPV